jgi:subtilisin family serine protease
MPVTARKDKDGVPLRSPRPVMVAAAISVVAAWAVLAGAPAQADQVRQSEWWLKALQITQAQQTTSGSGVTVALLDTGVDPAQPDLAGSVIPGPDETHSHEKPGSQFYGVHGTAMASLIVGHGHGSGKSDGILGVAPAARLLSVRVGLDSADPLLTDSRVTATLPAAIATGIRYAVNSGAQVIDLPLDPGQSPNSLTASTAPAPVPNPGQPPSPLVLAQQAAAGGSPGEKAAIAYALSKGVVLVAPAGDNNAQTDDQNFPAGYPGVISVGAFDRNVVKAPFSSRQSYVMLTASGSGVTAAIPAGGYTQVSTTAAASAVVTGIVALIKSVYPELTPAQVTKALETSTAIRPAGGLTDGSGHGTADAAKALAAAASIASPAPHRAGAGAVSRQQPAPPPIPFVDRGLGPKLERDGIISGALLVVLLLPIIVYALARRRRRRARTLARGDRAPAGRPVYAPAATQGDQMLDYFGSAPAQPRSLGSPVGAARPAAGGPGAFGGAADPRSAAGEEPGGRRLSGALGRLPLTPMTRTSAARPTKVSGTPPWEPAPQPDTELPWTTSPPPALARRTPMMPAPPAAPAGPQNGPASGSLWDIAEAAPPGRPAGADQAADEEPEPGASRPIYVWNPSANTDTFPKLPRDGG